MANFNKVIIAGNLTRDPELRYTPKGTSVAQISLAINRSWTTESGEKKEEVTFVEVSAFGVTAENIAKYLKKGRPLLVEGRLRLEQWEDKETGKPRQKLSVICESFQFMDGPATGAAGEDGRSKLADGKQQRAEDPQPDAPAEDDVPF